MIEPGFATMLCFVQTDAVVPDAERGAAPRRRRLLRADHGRRADEHQRHRPAAGERRRRRAAAGGPARRGAAAARAEIVADGEGATRVGRIAVSAARDGDEAERVARAIANSPLVKTALYGRDPNWGRIAQAAGHGARRRAGRRASSARSGSTPPSSAADDRRGRDRRSDLGRGEAAAHVYFSDLTHEYIRINAEYTT